MERAAREAVERAVERRKQTEEELTGIRRLLARMVVESVGQGWKLTVGGRDLQVTIEHPGASRGWGSDARRFTLYVTGNRWNDPGSCTSNLGGNEGNVGRAHRHLPDGRRGCANGETHSAGPDV